MRHIPRKRFGQHFLADTAIIAAIVDAIAPRSGDTMVEIGPGLGAITGPLAARVAKLIVIELDRDIVRRLQAGYADRIEIHSADVLAFDFARLPDNLRVVGNLPYNISTPLLFYLAGFAPRIRDMHFMLQREVVERMAAAPSTPAYGRLSVMLQLDFEILDLFGVSPEAFDPPPKVESAVVRMLPRPWSVPAGFDRAWFGEVVAAAFGQRRKTLRNSLGTLMANRGADGGHAAAAMARLGIDSGLRAENLGVAEFAALSVALSDALGSRLAERAAGG